MKIIFTVKKHNKLAVQLRVGNEVLSSSCLTISQGFDNMLITALDKLLRGTRIDRICLKSSEIQGKIEDKALWGMVLKTISKALAA